MVKLEEKVERDKKRRRTEKYLGSLATETRGLERQLSVWMHWRTVSAVFCDRTLKKRTKRTNFKSVERASQDIPG